MLLTLSKGKGLHEVKKIIIISDGTGETARRLMDSIGAHYLSSGIPFVLEEIHQRVRTIKQVDKIMKKITKEHLVLFSLVKDNVREYLHGLLESKVIIHMDVLKPMRETLFKFLGHMPKDYKPGLLQIIDDKYYRKVDAIGYTVKHDDGQGHQINEAELVLVGPSRTCKTPLSMYITSNFGLRVANIPIVPTNGMKKMLLKTLANVDDTIIIGLTMQPELLATIRERREELFSEGDDDAIPLDNYSNLQEIRNELMFCRRLYNEKGWVSVDVTRRAIEEISTEIIHELILAKEHPRKD